MSFLTAFFYDTVMKATEEACLIDWRKDLLKNVSGKVLEIGAGTGASIELYPSDSTLEVFLAEPDRNMRNKLEKRVKSQALSNVTVLTCPAENIDSDDEFFDFVFVSLVCCSVKNIDYALKEIKRVLKPDGGLVFLEHVAAKSGSKRRKWQDRFNAVWRTVAGNCHLNRETEEDIKNAGFSIHEIKHESMRKAMPLVRPTIRGLAKKN